MIVGSAVLSSCRRRRGPPGERRRGEPEQPAGPPGAAGVKDSFEREGNMGGWKSSWIVGLAAAAGLAFGGGSPAFAADALKTFVEQAMGPRTAQESELPTASPPAQRDKKLVSIVCASGIEGC